MARLIPRSIDDASPPGEKEVFNLLAGAPDDWTVMHSLDLAPWNNSRRTEIDFVVIIPDTGMLCIEVKSHREIGFSDGRWSPDSIRKSPFKQAADARFTLRNRLIELAEYVRNIPIVHCCVFPYARFDIRNVVSVAPWELVDATEFNKFKTSSDFCAALRALLREGIVYERFEPLTQPIPPQRVDSLVGLCLPIQLCVENAAEAAATRRRHMDGHLRSQQRPVLALAEDNERLLVRGGAGTGKTLIALELAQRRADVGERVLLVCYNRLVGQWMKDALGGDRMRPNLVVDSATRLLMRLADIKAPDSPPESYWSVDLPEAIQDRLTSPEFVIDAAFDYLIVDEAQDILARPALWHSLMSLLPGGEGSGRYALFGDLDYQVLSGQSSLETAIVALRASTSLTVIRMSENCRNQRPVGEAALSLSGLPALYTNFVRQGGSIDDVAIIPFDTPEDEVARVRSCMDSARAQGFKAREIVVLSFSSAEASCARRLLASGVRLVPAGWDSPDVKYSSVHAFKGMEASVVIVTDISAADGSYASTLFYTALTRSTAVVRVLCPTRMRERIIRQILGARK